MRSPASGEERDHLVATFFMNGCLKPTGIYVLFRSIRIFLMERPPQRPLSHIGLFAGDLTGADAMIQKVVAPLLKEQSFASARAPGLGSPHLAIRLKRSPC